MVLKSFSIKNTNILCQTILVLKKYKLNIVLKIFVLKNTRNIVSNNFGVNNYNKYCVKILLLTNTKKYCVKQF